MNWVSTNVLYQQPNGITESGAVPSEESEKPIASVEQVSETLANVEKPISPEASRKRKSNSPTEGEQSPPKKSKILVEAPVPGKKAIGPLKSLFPESKFLNNSLGTPYKTKIIKPADNVVSKDMQTTGSPPALKTAQGEAKVAKVCTALPRLNVFI